MGWGEGGYWHLVRLRFMSNVLAALVVVPVIMTWAANRSSAALEALARRHVEAGMVLFGLFAVGIFTFDLQESSPSIMPALVYAPLAFVLWAALHFGPVGTSTTMLILGSTLAPQR